MLLLNCLNISFVEEQCSSICGSAIVGQCNWWLDSRQIPLTIPFWYAINQRLSRKKHEKNKPFDTIIESEEVNTKRKKYSWQDRWKIKSWLNYGCSSMFYFVNYCDCRSYVCFCWPKELWRCAVTSHHMAVADSKKFFSQSGEMTYELPTKRYRQTICKETVMTYAGTKRHGNHHVSSIDQQCQVRVFAHLMHGKLRHPWQGMKVEDMSSMVTIELKLFLVPAIAIISCTEHEGQSSLEWPIWWW